MAFADTGGVLAGGRRFCDHRLSPGLVMVNECAYGSGALAGDVLAAEHSSTCRVRERPPSVRGEDQPGRIPCVPGRIACVPGRIACVSGRIACVPRRVARVPARVACVPARVSCVPITCCMRPITRCMRSDHALHAYRSRVACVPITHCMRTDHALHASDHALHACQHVLHEPETCRTGASTRCTRGGPAALNIIRRFPEGS